MYTKGRPFVHGLVLITLLGFVVRVMNVLWWRPTTDPPGYHGYRLWGDTFYYHWQANALAKGAWFVDPVPLDVPDGTDAQRRAPAALLASTSRSGRRSGSTVSPRTGWRRAARRRRRSSWSGCSAAASPATRPGSSRRGSSRCTRSLDQRRHAPLGDDGDLRDRGSRSPPCTVLAHAACATRCCSALACGAAALSRTELILLFPLVVLPLAAPLRALDWRRRHPPGRRRRRLLARCSSRRGWCSTHAVRRAPRHDQRYRRALSAASCDEVWYGKLIGYYANCFQGPWPEPGSTSRERDTRCPARAGDRVHRRTTSNGCRSSSRHASAASGDVFKPGQTTCFDWWIEGRGPCPSWIGLFAFYALMPFAVVGLVSCWRRRITDLPAARRRRRSRRSRPRSTFGVTRYRAAGRGLHRRRRRGRDRGDGAVARGLARRRRRRFGRVPGTLANA